MKLPVKLLCVALAASLWACSKEPETDQAAAPDTAAPAEEMVVRIGHVAPITGNTAHLGKDNENGATMAIEEINAQGLMIGGRKVRFELLFEDDAADPKQGTAAAQKLVDAKVNGVIGHLNSGTTIPASKIYFDAGIPQISPSATNPKYTLQGFNTAFRVVANDSQLGGTLGKYAVDTLKGKKIAVIDDRTAYGQGVAEEFAKSAQAAGATIASNQFTTNQATDFQAILTAIKGVKPEVVFYGGMDAQAGPLLRQMKQLGINAKLMGGDGMCTSALSKLSNDSVGDDQVVCAEAGGVMADRKANLEDFRARYKAKFGQDVQLYAPYVYDAVHVMVKAMQQADSVEPAKYLPALAKISHDGVTGKIEFDEHGDIRNGTLTLFTYRAGQKQEIAVVQ